MRIDHTITMQLDLDDIQGIIRKEMALVMPDHEATEFVFKFNDSPGQQEVVGIDVTLALKNPGAKLVKTS